MKSFHVVAGMDCSMARRHTLTHFNKENVKTDEMNKGEISEGAHQRHHLFEYSKASSTVSGKIGQLCASQMMYSKELMMMMMMMYTHVKIGSLHLNKLCPCIIFFQDD